MTEQFQRLGVLGDWDEPYLTMDFRYQAAIARAFGGSSRGARLQGQEAGALVHPLPHRARRGRGRVRRPPSPSIYVEFPLAPDSAGGARARVPALAGRDVSVLIWTTTPWTIPSNLAIAFHPEFDYAAYDVDGRAVIIAEGLRRAWSAAAGRRFGEPGRADEGRASSRASGSAIPSTTATRSACWPTT